LKTVLALGTGTVTPKEATDLLTDFLEDEDEVVLGIPGDTKRYNKTMAAVNDAFPWADVIYLVETGDKTSSKVDEDLVAEASLLEVVNDTDEQLDYVIVAIPDDEDDPFYDEIVEVVEAALERGVPVKDLTKGLDDIRIEEPTEPEAEADDTDETAVDVGPSPEDGNINVGGEDVPVEVFTAGLNTAGLEPTNDDRLALIEQWLSDALEMLQEYRQAMPVTDAPEISQEPTEPAEEPAPKRRGRPRKNPRLENQLYDEDEGEWVARGKGRIPKGTKIRTVDLDSGEVTEEGKA
jgi:hypothetical protein